MRPPPPPDTLPVVLCPACGHKIDKHAAGCGDYYEESLMWSVCVCQWSPNDIAAQRLADLAAQVQAWRDAAATRAQNAETHFDAGMAVAFDRVLAPLRDAS